MQVVVVLDLFPKCNFKVFILDNIYFMCIEEASKIS